ncbi:hypothetical protein [Haloparvum sedimenti]|uniref:hypothetical protein n=1 Tax=Haloparvum sedimenti TaxID=1678448 RepID=UPI0009B5C755|nr:hypothetical protein [Haloparvum sedimenti]
MSLSRTVTVLGVGLTAFLVATAVVTELAASAVEFSLFLGLPAGLVAGVVAAGLAHRRLSRVASPPVRGALAGVAAVSYAALALFAVRYAVSAARPFLSTATVVIVAVAVGAAVGVAVNLHVRRRENSFD